MPNSTRIAGLVGPKFVAMIVSEFPLVQPHLYDAGIRSNGVATRTASMEPLAKSVAEDLVPASQWR